MGKKVVVVQGGDTVTKQRKIKKGQMFLNLYSGWQNIFVVIGSNNAYYYGVEIIKLKGEYKVRNVKYYLATIRNDSEHFPLIGEMDIKAMWMDKVFERITADGREILNKNFDYYGHKIRVESEVES